MYSTTHTPFEPEGDRVRSTVPLYRYHSLVTHWFEQAEVLHAMQRVEEAIILYQRVDNLVSSMESHNAASLPQYRRLNFAARRLQGECVKRVLELSQYVPSKNETEHCASSSNSSVDENKVYLVESGVGGKAEGRNLCATTSESVSNGRN